MKHVIALGLMTLQLGAQVNAGNNLSEAVSKIQIMVAHDLDIPMGRVAELFQIVLEDLAEFNCIPEEVRDLIFQMRSAEA